MHRLSSTEFLRRSESDSRSSGRPLGETVPDLRGLPMFRSDSAAIGFLTTATLPGGRHALPPMPHYTFDRSDATAIVAYLRSLK